MSQQDSISVDKDEITPQVRKDFYEMAQVVKALSKDNAELIDRFNSV